MVTKVTITGDQQLINWLTVEAPEVIRKSADETAGVVAEMVCASAKRRVKVRTGRLQRSIRIMHPAPMVYEVVTNIYYGPFVEFGTWKMAAAPYLRPALVEYEAQIQSIFRDKVLESIYGW